MSTLVVPGITMTDAASPTEEQPRHHLHHHHHHLTKFTGKGADATGKRVVIGVDGSEHSNYACDWFFEHLWSPEDYVVLLNSADLHEVVKSQWGGGGVKSVSDRELADHRLKESEEPIHQKLEEFKEKLLQRGAHGKVRVASAKNPGDAIVNTAEEETADLIVIGCKGSSALKRTLLGTVSDYIVNHATVPVVVCRRKMSRRKSSSMIPIIPSELFTTSRH